ncbi:hypothetical protein NPIL_556771 [Nephila pilipes]|uniref:Uncharacterized protein n=1 Tax=Nephila pilipes TaxID=299642 RepID=A0A8X6Q6F8_NEPPI|nr:hypothetical protein NPIL_556771 [Nephila pilipes]
MANIWKLIAEEQTRDLNYDRIKTAIMAVNTYKQKTPCAGKTHFGSAVTGFAVKNLIITESRSKEIYRTRAKSFHRISLIVRHS